MTHITNQAHRTQANKKIKPMEKSQYFGRDGRETLNLYNKN